MFRATCKKVFSLRNGPWSVQSVWQRRVYHSTSRIKGILLENERHWIKCLALSVSGPPRPGSGFDVPLVPSLRGPDWYSAPSLDTYYSITKVEVPVKCLAEGHNKQTCRLIFTSNYFFNAETSSREAVNTNILVFWSDSTRKSKPSLPTTRR